MNLPEPLRRLWSRTMLRNTAFTRNYSKLRLLYSLEDPWDLGSDRERYRFERSNEMLRAALPQPGSLLELGCGEGHQTAVLSSLADRVVGLDISELAIRRARARCPRARFVVGTAEDAPRLFAGERFDLITACEVLYYTEDVGVLTARLQDMAPALFVSNYLPRSQAMREHFSGSGWRQLDTISFGETVWECFVWRRP